MFGRGPAEPNEACGLPDRTNLGMIIGIGNTAGGSCKSVPSRVGTMLVVILQPILDSVFF